MNAGTVIVLSIVVLGWAVISERLAAYNLSGPLVFLAAGLLLGNDQWGLVTVDIESSMVHLLAQLTLALLLFADASSVPLAQARRDLPLTSRLLGIGLPLSMLVGFGLAVLLFPSLPIALCGLIAASLAPTDAALSASVIGDERLPGQVRRSLNVESGLNDGIATPVVTLFIAASATAIGVVESEFEDGVGALGQLGIGIGIGLGVGLVGGWLVATGRRRGWMQEGAGRLATLSLALLAFLIASEASGNPFVAAFIGGLAFGSVARRDTTESVELAELSGSLMSLVVWFVFGAGLVMPVLENLSWRLVAYGAASLTIVRMLPVAAALFGSGEDRATTAFIGWFGPRGMASVVFALLAVEELGATDPRVLLALDAIAVTIVFSVVAHGVSARPLIGRYLRAIAANSGH